MATIHSDAAFKAALSRLPVEQQRRVGKLFVENVIDVSDNPKVKQAISIADKSDLSATEIAEGFKIAKAAAIDSYTLCGRDADWLGQASHFVASAAAVCLTPGDQVAQCRDLAWSTAMNARMAKVCETIAHEQSADNQEAEKQYAILETFLATD